MSDQSRLSIHEDQSRFSRRRFAAGAALAPLAGLSLMGAAASAQSTRIVSTQVGDVPTTGGVRPGPVGLAPEPITRNRGVTPAAIQIPSIAVDAQIEIIDIVDGIMQNPNGPFIVSWYLPTARLGAPGNVVMAGHVDYWNVGPAIFFDLRNLGEGDSIDVYGEDGSIHTYDTQWLENVDNINITPQEIQAIVGPTRERALTLITCGGPFDYATGQYLERLIVRAHLADIQSPPSSEEE